jgi:hypothetical protein
VDWGSRSGGGPGSFGYLWPCCWVGLSGIDPNIPYILDEPVWLGSHFFSGSGGQISSIHVFVGEEFLVQVRCFSLGPFMSCHQNLGVICRGHYASRAHSVLGHC